MSDPDLPPPFVVGHKYHDRDGEYTVIATAQDQVTIERPDGRRTTANVELKARIHRNVIGEREATVQKGRPIRRKKRPEPTKRRKELIDRILQLEADGETHSGVEIDRLLAGMAQDLGYSDDEITGLPPGTGRSAFANDGDWAKAVMTEDGLHEVAGTTVYRDGDARRECNVYRITPSGLDEFRRRPS